jgi:hypothetical protein
MHTAVRGAVDPRNQVSDRPLAPRGGLGQLLPGQPGLGPQLSQCLPKPNTACSATGPSYLRPRATPRHPGPAQAVAPGLLPFTAWHGLAEGQYPLAPRGSGLIMRLVLADSRLL